LSAVIRTPLELQLMAGAECLCHIFEWGREMKKVGNHWTKMKLNLIFSQSIGFCYLNTHG